jgi:divalent metal cation (Fe/Co/Zn/Cd) transporter
VSIIWSAGQRLIDPQPLSRLGPGILVAFFAGAMNFATARIMLKVARQHDSITIEADAKHLLTDVWTSVGIIAGLLIVTAMPQWTILDPLMAIAVGVHIIVTGVSLLRRSADGLMDVALPSDEIGKAEVLIAAELPAEASFHALRTRKAGARRFLEFHVLVPGTMNVADSHALCDRIEAALTGHLPKAHITIHVEPKNRSTAFLALSGCFLGPIAGRSTACKGTTATGSGRDQMRTTRAPDGDPSAAASLQPGSAGLADVNASASACRPSAATARHGGVRRCSRRPGR